MRYAKEWTSGTLMLLASICAANHIEIRIGNATPRLTSDSGWQSSANPSAAGRTSATTMTVKEEVNAMAAMPPLIWGVSLFGFLGLVWGTFMGLRLATEIQ